MVREHECGWNLGFFPGEWRTGMISETSPDPGLQIASRSTPDKGKIASEGCFQNINQVSDKKKSQSTTDKLQSNHF